jgi:hypothetical protein
MGQRDLCKGDGGVKRRAGGEAAALGGDLRDAPLLSPREDSLPPGFPLCCLSVFGHLKLRWVKGSAK